MAAADSPSAKPKDEREANVLTKLLTILSTAKGAAAAGVLAAASISTGVVATNPEIQDAVGSAVENVTEAVSNVVDAKPPVVAARNGADKKLRDAFQKDHQILEKLRSSKVEGADRSKLGDLVKAADAKLRDRLTLALNDVAALTLGREGTEADKAGDARADGSAKPSRSPKPSESPKSSGSPDVKVAFTADAQAKVDGIVKSAIADMDKITADATAAVAALPTFTPGKPSDRPGGKPSDKPSDNPGGKPSDRPGGKPSDNPGGKPSDAPGGKPDTQGGPPSAKPTR